MTEWDVNILFDEFETILTNAPISYDDDSYQSLTDCSILLTLLKKIAPLVSDYANNLLNEKLNNSKMTFNDYFSKLYYRINEVKSTIINKHIQDYLKTLSKTLKIDDKILNAKIPIIRYDQVEEIGSKEYIKTTKEKIPDELKKTFDEIIQERLFIDTECKDNSISGKCYSVCQSNKSYIYLNGINPDCFASLPHELTHATDSKLTNNFLGKISYSSSLISEINPLLTELIFLDSLKSERHFFHFMYSYHQIIDSYQNLAKIFRRKKHINENDYIIYRHYITRIIAFYLFYLYKNDFKKYQEVKSIYEKNIFNFNTDPTNNIFLEFCTNINNNELISKPFDHVLQTYANHFKF